MMLFYRHIFTIFLVVFLVKPLSAEFFTIEHYDIQIRVSQSGYFDVVETIDLLFSEPRRGIIRAIPNKYLIDGKNVKIRISDVKVDHFKYKTSQSGNDLEIRIGDPNIFLEGRQSYTIRYRVKDAFLFLDEHTEFYWNLIGIEWGVDILAATFKIELENLVSLAEEDYNIFAGRFGTQESKVEYLFRRGIITGNTTEALLKNEGITAAIKLPVEYIQRPGKWELLWKKYGWLAVPIIVLGFFSGLFFRLYTRYGKNKPIVKMVQFYPPEELTAPEAGVLIDDKADNRDVIALIPFWAARGLIEIHALGEGRKSDQELRKIQELPADAHSYERTIWNGLFSGNKSSVRVSSLKEKFYSHIQLAKSQLKYDLRSKDVYTPNSVRYQQSIGAIGSILLVCGVVVIFLFQAIAIGISIILSGVLGFLTFAFMLKKNEKGLRLYEHLVGYRMFMDKAEKPRLERLLEEDPQYFEKSLPYAIMFGFAKKWGEKFDGLTVEPPRGYVGPAYSTGRFMPGQFAGSFEKNMNSIQSAFTSVPQSSGGGGGFGGGGGSVGGGFGGGGGRSW
jgi:uncharacterized membrane protein YgcG